MHVWPIRVERSGSYMSVTVSLSGETETEKEQLKVVEEAFYQGQCMPEIDGNGNLKLVGLLGVPTRGVVMPSDHCGPEAETQMRGRT